MSAIKPAFREGRVFYPVTALSQGRVRAYVLPWIALLGVWIGLGAIAHAKTIVIAIGNNRGHAHEQELSYAQRDARSFASVFQTYGGAHPRDTVLLEGRSAKDITSTLARIKQEVAALGPKQKANTKLVVYYSGHADGLALHPGTSRIRYETLRRAMQAVDARVRILVVDSCRSGGLTRVKGVKPAATFAISATDEISTSGIAIISSSTATEDSHESDRLQGSFFTHHFLNGLRGIADENRDGKVSLRESYHYAYHQTLRSSSQTLALQHPTLENHLRGRGELVLSIPAMASNDVARVVLHAPALYLVFQAKKKGSLVAELQSQHQNQVLRLAPGQYKIQARGTDRYQNYMVDLKPGDHQTLDPQHAQVVAYEQLVRKGGPKKSSNSVSLMFGARGPIPMQSKVSFQSKLGYTLHLKHLSLTGMFRWGAGSFRHQAPSQALSTTELEWGLGVNLEKYVDFRRLSLAFGLWVEACLIQQRIRSFKPEPRRNGLGAAFGGNVALQVPLAERIGARLELSSMTYVIRRAQFANGIEREPVVRTPLTGLANLGVYYRF